MDDARACLVAALDRAGTGSSDFDLNSGAGIARPVSLREAAVLVGVQPDPTGARVILTKRASHLSQHPGQIAFAGGKIDDTDQDAVSAALREASEEIGLHPTAVEVLGTLPRHHTVTGYSITPVLGWVANDFTAQPEPGEVAEVFSVPLSHLTDTTNFRVEGRFWRGGLRNYYTVPYGPYYIWGATARILRGLAERMTG